MACSAAALPAFFLTALTGVDNKYISMLNDALFVCEIREYLVDDMLIGTYRDLVAAQLGTALMVMSTTIMTIWVAYQGFMIISGTNRKPILALGLQTGKMMLILSLVALVAGKSPVIAETVLNFQALISAAIVGEGTDIYRTIDINVGLAVVFNAVVDGLVGGQQSGADGKAMTTIAGLVGQTGPAMVISAYSLAAEVFITLAIMLSPVFIFFLLFQQTAGKFWSWIRYLLGTMFSLAVLVLVGSVLLKMMMAYGAGVIAAFFLNASSLGTVISVDIAGSAMRMAMMGGLSSALLLMIPPVIMGFFNSGASFAANALASAVGGGAGTAAMMQAMQKDGGGNAPSASGAPSLGHSGGASEGGMAAGSAALNHQIQQSIATRGAQGGGGAGSDGPPGDSRMMTGSRGHAGVDARVAAPGLAQAQLRQQGLAATGELRENKTTGVYETADTAQSLRNDPSLGKGGHLNVSSGPSSSEGVLARNAAVDGNAAASVGGTAVAQSSVAALNRSQAPEDLSGAGPSYGSVADDVPSGATSAPPGGGPTSTPVYALPPLGLEPTLPPAGRFAVLDAAAREPRNPAALRPSMPDRFAR